MFQTRTYQGEEQRSNTDNDMFLPSQLLNFLFCARLCPQMHLGVKNKSDILLLPIFEDELITTYIF